MSEITPEKVAAVLSKGHAGWRWGLDASLSVTAQSNVLHLETTRWLDDEEGTEVVEHFRAVVVEGETDPIVLPAGAACDYINGDDGYHWLTCGTCEESLLQVEAGTHLVEMVQAISSHTCPAEAAQTEKGGTP